MTKARGAQHAPSCPARAGIQARLTAGTADHGDSGLGTRRRGDERIGASSFEARLRRASPGQAGGQALRMRVCFFIPLTRAFGANPPPEMPPAFRPPLKGEVGRRACRRRAGWPQAQPAAERAPRSRERWRLTGQPHPPCRACGFAWSPLPVPGREGGRRRAQAIAASVVKPSGLKGHGKAVPSPLTRPAAPGDLSRKGRGVAPCHMQSPSPEWGGREAAVSNSTHHAAHGPPPRSGEEGRPLRRPGATH